MALREDLRGGAMFRALDRNLPMQDEQVIREVCSMLAAWATVAEEGERLGPLDSGMVVPLVLHTEVRTKFPTLWSFPTEEGGVVVERVAAERRAELEAEREGDQLEEQLVSSLLGFTLLFRHLSSSGVPVVGHNCLLDLLLMFRQFEAKLPADYAAFKAELHQLFPVVFDTKHIAHELRSRVGRRWPQLERILASSNLSSLHQELAKGHGRAGAPSVVAPPGFERYEGRAAPHEAAYDALLAGGCWLGLAHLAASLGTPGTDRPLAFGEKLAALAGHRNRVNVARAALNHAHLAGADPACARPVWLHVTSLRAPLARAALAERLGRWGSSSSSTSSYSSSSTSSSSSFASCSASCSSGGARWTCGAPVSGRRWWPSATTRRPGRWPPRSGQTASSRWPGAGSSSACTSSLLLLLPRYRLARHSAPARAALVAAVVAGLGLGLALIYRRAAASGLTGGVECLKLF